VRVVGHREPGCHQPRPRGPPGGLPLFPDLPVLAHASEVGAIRSPEVLLAGFGLGPQETGVLQAQLRDTLHLSGHQDVGTFEDGDVVDLGGRTLTVLHLPGHTAGHRGFLVEPDGFLFLADIDLTSFGPYYGDLSSSLEDFEASPTRLREVGTRWYGTSHHVGVLDDRQTFLGALDRFTPVIRRRSETLLQLLRQPRTPADVVASRLVYRPHVQLPFVEAVDSAWPQDQPDSRCVSHSWKAPMWCSEGTSTPPLA
jgi:glyoxylase-like metal-dependent hydrolase (beta-lactamase superfamily II)